MSYESGVRRCLLAGASSLVLLAGSSGAAYAQDGSGETMETVTVTGFKASLEKALDMKRNSLSASDSIMAEDIAKFPDLNVSEALQRIPGVAIQRDGGEGRQISVRGLGPSFTRVRVNGMEAVATLGGADSAGNSSGGATPGGTNRGRSFDFNMFGSELFTNLTVYKSASAHLEEGSLGATIDMHTARPFDFNKFVLSANVAGGYNQLAGSFNPRASVLISDTMMGGRLGVLFSASFAARRLIEDGASTVRWQNDLTQRTADGTAPHLSGCVAGTTSSCATNQRFASVMGKTTGDEYDFVNEGFKPRMPRYDLYHTSMKRYGLSAVVQWAPLDGTEMTLTSLYADHASTREESYLEVTTLSTTGTTAGIGVRQAAVTDYHLDATTNTLDYLKINNAGIRVENRIDHLDTRFMQETLEVKQVFSSALTANLLLGWTESHHRNPVQNTMVMDLLNVQGYSYDFRESSKAPLLGYGNADVTATGTTLCTAAASSCNAWFLSQVRSRPQQAFNSFRNAQGDVSYQALSWLKLTAGFNVKNFGFRTTEYRFSDGSTSTFETVQNLSGTLASASEKAYLGTVGDAVLSTPVSSYVKSVSMPSAGLGLPKGLVTSWLVPDTASAFSALGFDTLPLGTGPAIGNNRTTHENNYSGWFELAWDTLFYGMPFRGDIGGRLVETEQTSTGNSYDAAGNSVQVVVHNNYHDFLPSFNAVFEPTDTFLIRLNLAQVMARPDLGDLTGTSVSVSGANRTMTIGNPHLKPFRASTVDLAYEWYYHKGAMLSLAFFYKKIGTYVQLTSNSASGNASTGYLSYTAPDGELFVLNNAILNAACGAATGCSATSSWTVSKSINTPGGNVQGAEINWQQPFDFLPGRLENFGVLGNVTYVDSSVLNGTDASARRITMLNQSKISYNATLYYDDTVFQARVSAAYRGRYTTRNPGRNNNDIEGTGATFNLDASASYKIDENLTLALDGLNLTNQAQFQYVDSVERMSVNHQTGREVYIGLRYNY
ncbi:TonB-dependent receptor [Rhizomicrobium electricum]|uniref:TonB-dependent receptor n=1 Tax=Rhizomicrobium electricum TaxID=480070 RepID=A0ABP3Q8M6_9PROT|nr:TonB-dependent receptor [Rhizomicrobium electricum]NIJ49480.1 TonB-dependent receptor [Rhizomicrobium electricum]